MDWDPMPVVPRTPGSRQRDGATVSIYELKHEISRKAWSEYEKAHKFLAADDLTNAEAHFNKAIAIDPEFVDAHNDLAAVYLKEAKAEPAIDHLEAAIKADPECAVAYSNLTVAYLMQGKTAAAETAARRTASIDRTGSRTRLILGLTLVMENKYTAETEAVLAQAAADYPQAMLLLGRTKAHRGNYAGARAQIERYLTTASPLGREMAQEWLGEIKKAEIDAQQRQSASVR